MAVASADFNHDGIPDLAVTSSSMGKVSIFLANADGTLQAARSYKVGQRPGPLSVADFDHDGNLDLAILNLGGASVSILLGKGDGSFQSVGD